MQEAQKCRGARPPARPVPSPARGPAQAPATHTQAVWNLNGHGSRGRDGRATGGGHHDGQGSSGLPVEVDLTPSGQHPGDRSGSGVGQARHQVATHFVPLEFPRWKSMALANREPAYTQHKGCDNLQRGTQRDLCCHWGSRHPLLTVQTSPDPTAAPVGQPPPSAPTRTHSQDRSLRRRRRDWPRRRDGRWPGLPSLDRGVPAGVPSHFPEQLRAPVCSSAEQGKGKKGAPEGWRLSWGADPSQGEQTSAGSHTGYEPVTAMPSTRPRPDGCRGTPTCRLRGAPCTDGLLPPNRDQQLVQGGRKKGRPRRALRSQAPRHHLEDRATGRPRCPRSWEVQSGVGDILPDG